MQKGKLGRTVWNHKVQNYQLFYKYSEHLKHFISLEDHVDYDIIRNPHFNIFALHTLDILLILN